jgi:hypothetical protein
LRSRLIRPLSDRLKLVGNRFDRGTVEQSGREYESVLGESVGSFTQFHRRSVAHT